MKTKTPYDSGKVVELSFKSISFRYFFYSLIGTMILFILAPNIFTLIFNVVLGLIFSYGMNRLEEENTVMHGRITRLRERITTRYIVKSGKSTWLTMPLSSILENESLNSIQIPKISGTLTGIGLFGTFTGICIGLFNMDIKNPTELISSTIPTLIGGMNTAFVSSAVGIFASIMFTVLEAKKNRRIETAIENIILENNLRDIPLESATEHLRALSTFRNATEELETAATQIAKASTEMTKTLGSSVNAIETKLDAIKDIKDSTKLLSQFVSKDLAGMFKEVATSVKLSKSSIDSTNSAMNETRLAISEQNESQKTLSNLLKNFTKELSSVVISTAEKSSETIQKAGNQVEEVLKSSGTVFIRELERFRDEYAKSIQKYVNEQNMALDKQLTEYNKKFSSIVSSFGDVFKKDLVEREKQLKDVDTITTRMAKIMGEGKAIDDYRKDSILKIAEQLSKTSKDAEKNSRAISELGSILQDIKDILGQETSKTLENFSAAQRKVIDEYQENVDAHLSEILSRLLATANALSAASSSRNS